MFWGSIRGPRVRCWCETTVLVFLVHSQCECFWQKNFQQIHKAETYVFQTGRKSLVHCVSQLHLFPPIVLGKIILHNDNLQELRCCLPDSGTSNGTNHSTKGKSQKAMHSCTPLKQNKKSSNQIIPLCGCCCYTFCLSLLFLLWFGFFWVF